jgi:Sulfotransferase family
MLASEQLVEAAIAETGFSNFGGESYRDGLDRLVGSLNDEADLNGMGHEIYAIRLKGALVNRLRVENTYARHPEIEDEVIAGPIVILGLPRTGTTATSQLIAADPAVRSLRLWESGSPVPPPESATQETDPRIAATEAGLQMMYETFPKMRSLHFETATGPTECIDLLSMEFRTAHYDGMANVPSYTDWVVDCEMAGAYGYHRRVLKLLQSRCGPNLWHLKTPIHMLSLPALTEAFPEAVFIWTHRDPAEVLGSVCSLIAYTRSWVSDREESEDFGSHQVEFWSEALKRAIEFRQSASESRFADIYFRELQSDPVSAIGSAYEKLGLNFSAQAEQRMAEWRTANPPGAHGTHEFSLGEFGLDAGEVTERFGFYLERFGLRDA